MKETPILFKGPLVRAILDGRKTMTRRIVKPQFIRLWGWGVRLDEPNHFSIHVDVAEPDGSWKWIKCPYGKVGDRLWVRETWLPLHRGDYHDNRFPKDTLIHGRRNGAAYRAECDADADSERCRIELGYKKWKPSIYMPRWASRINLEITGIKVERLNAISEQDATLEGVENEIEVPGISSANNRDRFKFLWESINGENSWNENPWVWVVEFKQIKES